MGLSSGCGCFASFPASVSGVASWPNFTNGLNSCSLSTGSPAHVPWLRAHSVQPTAAEPNGGGAALAPPPLTPPPTTAIPRGAARSGATQHALGCSSGPAGQRQREGAPGKGRPGVKALFSAHAPASSASQLASTAAREHFMCTQHACPCRSAPASVRTGLCAGPGQQIYGPRIGVPSMVPLGRSRDASSKKEGWWALEIDRLRQYLF